MTEENSVIPKTPDEARDGEAVRCSALLSGVESLTKPNYHKLNVHAGRNDRLLHAVLCAYAKHHLDFDDIGWDQLGDMLQSVICNEIGDDAFCRWLETMRKD